MKKTLNKIRVRVLKALTALACVMWCLGVCSLDSYTNHPIYVVLLTTAWITLIYVANCRR